MKSKIILFVVIILFVQLQVYSQVTTTVNTNIRPVPAGFHQSEVHISINKVNPKNILISFNTDNPNPNYSNRGQQGYSRSTDDGQTWDKGDNKAPQNSQNQDQISYCDPGTGFDALGRGYITTLSPSNMDGYYYQFTDDFGTNWSNAIRGVGPVGGAGIDKEMFFSVDELGTSTYANNFYCAWTDFSDHAKVKLNRATRTNNGLTFDNNVITLSQVSESGQGTNVQTGPNGEVYVCWTVYGENGALPGQYIGFASSTNGFDSHTSSHAFPITSNRRFPVDGDFLFNYTRVHDYPSMAVDRSCGSLNQRGRIYIAYTEWEDPLPAYKRCIIKVQYSDDGGTTWIAANGGSQININGNGTNGNPIGRQNWFPWIAVDDLTGLVNVVYYTFSSEDNPTNDTTNFQTETYVAYSTDFGSTWQNIKVSDQPHITEKIGNYTGGYAGDYIGISSFGGKSWAAWGDHRGYHAQEHRWDEPWQIYVTRIDYNNIKLTTSTINDLYINTPSLLQGKQQFKASNDIYCANIHSVATDNNSNVEFVAGNQINLKPGFSTSNNSQFSAKILDLSSNPCETPGSIQSRIDENPWSSSGTILKENLDNVKLFLYPNPSTDFITVGCINNNFTDIQISISDLKGNYYIKDALPDLVSNEQIRKIFDINKFPVGSYFVNFKIDNKIYSLKFTKK